MDLATSIKMCDWLCRHCGLHQLPNLLGECIKCGYPIEPRFDKNGRPIEYTKLEGVDERNSLLLP